MTVDVGELGMVVKAWDLAVATMKPGEKSRFYCKYLYVYTDDIAQSTDSHQQNFIVYDIELIHWQGFYMFFNNVVIEQQCEKYAECYGYKFHSC